MRVPFRLFVFFIVAVVIATVAVGLYLSGSPAQERLRRLDDEKSQDLQQIKYSIDQYQLTNKQLPNTLGDLRLEPSFLVSYEYARMTTSTYELCALFQTDTAQPPMVSKRPYPAYPGEVTANFFLHAKGHVCFPSLNPLLR